MSHGNEMLCQPVTLSGDAEWPKVADAVIEALLQAVKQGCAELPHRLQGISIQQRPHALPQQPLAAEFCPDGSEHSTAGAFGRLKTPAASPWHTPRRDAARPGRRCAHSCRLAFSGYCTSHVQSSTEHVHRASGDKPCACSPAGL